MPTNKSKPVLQQQLQVTTPRQAEVKLDLILVGMGKPL